MDFQWFLYHWAIVIEWMVLRHTIDISGFGENGTSLKDGSLKSVSLSNPETYSVQGNTCRGGLPKLTIKQMPKYNNKKYELHCVVQFQNPQDWRTVQVTFSSVVQCPIPRERNCPLSLTVQLVFSSVISSQLAPTFLHRFASMTEDDNDMVRSDLCLTSKKSWSSKTEKGNYFIWSLCR